MAKDLFSNHAKEYAAFRPRYPKELYDFIFNQVNHLNQAWDCATGNGQVASVLASKFRTVHATDISPKQIEQAVQKENISYQVGSAETSGFEANTIDLITVGQAIHWFDLVKFYSECKRVARPKAPIACFGYSPVRCNNAFDKAVDDFYFNVIYSYWETERRMVEDQYVTLPFPFEQVLTANFKIELSWTLLEVAGYINTWSAVKKYIEVNKVNPVDALIDQIQPLWTMERQSVYFPVFLRLGRIVK